MGINKNRRIPIRSYAAYGCASVATILWVLFYYEVSRGGFPSEAFQNNRGVAHIIIGFIPILFFWLVAQLYNVATLNRDRYKELNKKIGFLQGELDHALFGESDKFMNPSTGNPSEISEVQETNEEPEQLVPESESMHDLQFNPLTPSEEAKDEASLIDEWNLDASTLIRAFNLPNDENDAEGYDAIDAAVRIESIATLLENSHQLLYTLADYDLIMDDLEIDLGLISTWRKYATDSTEGTVSSLGGTGTYLEIDKVSSIVNENSDFEERASTFNSHMDKFISQAIPQLKDEEIRKLAQTRTFRAFLLLGQVSSAGYNPD